MKLFSVKFHFSVRVEIEENNYDGKINNLAPLQYFEAQE